MTMRSQIKTGPRTRALQLQRQRQAEAEDRQDIEMICFAETICAVVMEDGDFMQLPPQWVSLRLH
jgi:hypothetical protein